MWFFIFKIVNLSACKNKDSYKNIRVVEVDTQRMKKVERLQVDD